MEIICLTSDKNYKSFETNFNILVSIVSKKKFNCFIHRPDGDKLEGKLSYNHGLNVHYKNLMSIGAFLHTYCQSYELKRDLAVETVGETWGSLKLKWIQIEVAGNPTLYDLITYWTPEQIIERFIPGEKLEDYTEYTKESEPVDLYSD